jgi:hypothetical protein
MTTRTIKAAEVPVPGVIESRAEARQSRERLHGSRLRVRMTDRANLTPGVCKLLRVATGAGRVVCLPRHRRPRVISFPSMTQEARQSRVVRVVVLEF